MNHPLFSTRNVWNPVGELRREVDRLFNDYTPAASDWSPACDIEEAQNHFLITLEMAGVPKDAVKIEFLDDQLTISGERRQELKKEDSAQWYSERRYGKFQRTFALPPGVNHDKLEAHFDNGVLRVYVPKAEAAKPREIKIGAGTAAEGGFFSRFLGTSQREGAGLTLDTKTESKSTDSRRLNMA